MPHDDKPLTRRGFLTRLGRRSLLYPVCIVLAFRLHSHHQRVVAIVGLLLIGVLDVTMAIVIAKRLLTTLDEDGGSAPNG